MTQTTVDTDPTSNGLGSEAVPPPASTNSMSGAAAQPSATAQPDGNALPSPDGDSGEAARRVVKRYSNRKLYDTRQSRYVTLLQIAEMVRAGEDVQIIDNATKEDKTDVTLALIISEELKARPRAIPLATLRALIRNRGGRLLTQLRDSPIGRLIPAEEEAGAEGSAAMAVGEVGEIDGEEPSGLRRTFDHLQHAVDERIRTLMPHFSSFGELQTEINSLKQRVRDLEQEVAEKNAELANLKNGN